MKYILTFLIIFQALLAGPEAWNYPNCDLSEVQSVALYRGSFDPLHNGHASIVEKCMRSGCSHVFFFPAFGMGEKERSALSVRTELLEIYSEGKEVSVLDFTIPPDMESDIETLKGVRRQVVDWILALQAKGIKVYKVLGGDAAYKEADALPGKPPNVIDGYILASRDGYPITEELVERYQRLGIEVIAVEPDFQKLSSTELRRQIAEGEDISPFVPPETMKIIEKYSLYKGGDDDLGKCSSLRYFDRRPRRG